MKNGLDRGKFTYTDLYSLLQSNSFCEKVKSVFHLFVQVETVLKVYSTKIACVVVVIYIILFRIYFTLLTKKFYSDKVI